ncbi:MAG TPA: hypothetical protein VJU77_08270 [Chthoniobacterales bacterium]|nr:hypothetical protein [Chthoniobacterales bacterium]
MQPGEALSTAAQVAVTLAGFAGIVVVFRPDSVHRWSAIDRFRLQLLLTNSALPLAEALFGLLLLSADPPPASIWRWCSGFGFAAQLLVIVGTRNRTRRLSRADLEGVHKLLFYPIALLATAAMALQAINFSVWNRFWPFFGLIFIHLVAALAQFVRMVLLPPHSPAD